MKSIGRKVSVHLYYIRRMMVYYHFGEYQKACEMAVNADDMMDVSVGFIYTTDHYLFYSLVIASLYRKADISERIRYWRILKRNKKKMKKWADLCPDNFLHKYLLISAEMSGLKGRNDEAAEFYHKAIKSAGEYRYINNEALANELAAKFWLARGYEEIAGNYMTEAHGCYMRWGAAAKAEHLGDKYPGLISSVSRMETAVDESHQSAQTSVSAVSNSNPEEFDLSTITKSSQALSGEIQLEKLLQIIMKIALQNAGAEKAFLIIEKDGELFMEAEGSADNLETGDEAYTSILKSIPVEKTEAFSSAIVKYVLRTGEDLVLGNASEEGIFAEDTYVIKNKPGSILCFKIEHYGKSTAIVYLENNLAKYAFTPERIEVLRILTTQASIAIENERLYTEREYDFEKIQKGYEFDKGISFKENGNYHVVDNEDIIYLSSMAKRAFIYTEERIFEASHILKDIEKKLPAVRFIRIHRQYILNIKYISNIQYFIGGQYVVYMKDEDNTTLPVGRKYVSSLKERLRI